MPLDPVDWTDKDAVLRARWAAGVSLAQIGREIGVGKGALTKRRIKLELPERGMGFRSDLGPHGKVEKKGRAIAATSSMAATREGVAIVRKAKAASLESQAQKHDALPGSRMLTLRAIKPRRQCMWPYGDPARDDFRYCAADCDVTESYCAGHRALAYLPPVRAHNSKNWRAA